MPPRMPSPLCVLYSGVDHRRYSDLLRPLSIQIYQELAPARFYTKSSAAC